MPAKNAVPIVLCKGGTGEKVVDLTTHRVDDLWHIAGRIKDKDDREKVLEVWRLAHTLRDYILSEKGIKEFPESKPKS